MSYQQQNGAGASVSHTKVAVHVHSLQGRAYTSNAIARRQYTKHQAPVCAVDTHVENTVSGLVQIAKADKVKTATATSGTFVEVNLVAHNCAGYHSCRHYCCGGKLPRIVKKNMKGKEYSRPIKKVTGQIHNKRGSCSIPSHLNLTRSQIPYWSEHQVRPDLTSPHTKRYLTPTH